MRVLQVNATYGFGSTGIIVEDIGKTLQKYGHEAYFAYQRTNQKISNGYQIGNKFDWKLHALLCRIFGRQGFYSSIPTKRFLNHIDKVKPDVVHLHNSHGNYIHNGILWDYLAKKNIPTVITMHDCWNFTGKCFHYIDVGCNKFGHNCEGCPKQHYVPNSIFFDVSATVLNSKSKILNIPKLKVVGCSNWICGEAKKGILQNCDIVCINNGVDCSVFKPNDCDSLKQELGIKDEFVVLGMANKWLLPENISIIKKVLNIANIKLVIVGCNNSQKRQLMDIDKDILAIGYIKGREELARYYNIADVFVNLTHADTLPTVNMESIACGTPVVTYDNSGSTELVDNNITGIVVQDNNQNAILEAIEKIKTMSFTECRNIALQKFDKNKSYESYVDLYSSII